MASHEETTVLRSVTVWKQLSKERRQSMARAFWVDEESVAQQAEAIELIARQLKFRPRSVRALDLDRKARYLAALQQPTEALVARLLVSYHLESQRPMMGAFLDALGIAHEDGLIIAEEPAVPDRKKVAAASAALLEKFPHEDVLLYFSTLLSQDPETWGALADVPELEEQLRSSASRGIG
jgi:hypothetical protein